MIPRIVIAGTKSGVGKTTLTSGIMAALQLKGLKVQGFKVGPDYIDPSYHAAATGRPSSNLDLWLMGEEGVKTAFSRRTLDSDIAVVEGVMGLFDGNFKDGSGSTAHIAKLLKAPVVLVLDCRSMGQSAAAHVLGFKLFDPEVNVAGVILNQVGSLRHGEVLKQVIEEKTDIPVVGIVLRDEELALPSRHLGLIPMAERDNNMKLLGEKTTASINIEEIIRLAHKAEIIDFPLPQDVKQTRKVRWAVAQDEAFSFAYIDALEEIKSWGVELVPFSPLKDKNLPEECEGLIIGGGFPEIYAAELAENTPLLAEIKSFAESGLPVYAECGGLMFLTERIVTSEGISYSMAGVVPAETIMQNRLVAMGYVEATALKPNILCNAEEKVKGHVFHYSELKPLVEDFPWAWQLQFTRGSKTQPDGYAKGNVLASYVHLHFQGLKGLVKNVRPR